MTHGMITWVRVFSSQFSNTTMEYRKWRSGCGSQAFILITQTN